MSYVSTLTVPQARRFQRAALTATGIDSLGTGSYVSAAVVLFTQHLSVNPAAVGFGLTLSAISGMLASLPISALADRWGNLRVFTCSYILRALGTLVWVFISGDAQYLAYSLLFGVIDRSAASLTRSLMVAPLSKEDSIRLIGLTALPANIGYGLGAGLSALVLFLNLPIIVILGLNSATFIFVIILYRLTLRDLDLSKADVSPSVITSWTRIKSSLASSHRRRIVFDNFLFSFHRTFLNVYFPLAVVVYAPNYVWVVPVLFVVNAVVVALTQAAVNAWADQRNRHQKLWGISGLLLGISMFPVPLFAAVGEDVAGKLLIGLLIVQIAAEIAQSAALTVYMVRMSREENLATDLSAINLGGQFQNITGPAIFSSLVVPERWPLAILAGAVIGARGVLVLRRPSNPSL